MRGWCEDDAKMMSEFRRFIRWAASWNFKVYSGELLRVLRALGDGVETRESYKLLIDG